MTRTKNATKSETKTPEGSDDPLAGPDTLRSPVDPSDFERAFAEVEAEIRAVPTEELLPITGDVRSVAVNTIARLPRIQTLRAEIAERVSRPDLEALDRLETYALAAAHADFRSQTSAAASAVVAELSARATERRSVLLASVKTFVARGLMDGAPLAGLDGSAGHRCVAHDVLSLRNMLVEAWPWIADKTVLSAEDLEEDAAIASRLLTAAGARSVVSFDPGETARARNQAFALFVKKYDQVRSAVSLVRWEKGDADEYAPSLYADRDPLCIHPVAPAVRCVQSARSADLATAARCVRGDELGRVACS